MSNCWGDHAASFENISGRRSLIGIPVICDTAGTRFGGTPSFNHAWTLGGFTPSESASHFCDLLLSRRKSASAVVMSDMIGVT